MISILGSDPPLHRRYNEENAMEHVRNRYISTKDNISTQVTVLQAFEPFRSKCSKLYAQGFRDWMILSTILNCMLNWDMRQKKIDFKPESFRKNQSSLLKSLQGKTFASELYITREFEMNMELHFDTVLITWGFEVRRRTLDSDVVRKFLRERMRHFDNDLPHANMFGEPPGGWPDL